jgi:transposase
MFSGEEAAIRRAAKITLVPEQRQMLEKLVRSPRTPVRLVLRSSVILLAGDGIENRDIAKKLRLARGTVGKWRTRFSEDGFAGIEKDATRPGRSKKYLRAKVAAIVRKTTTETPPGQTHWSRTSMARETGVSEATIGRIWRAHGLKPHLFRTFKISNDPRFAEKLEEIVGLYLHPPEHAVVFAADEKSQIQALDRTQPGLPLKRGRCGTMTHDYKRHGTTTLFAALNVATGRVIGVCMQRHRHQEWLAFLRLLDRETPTAKVIHVIADNYATHKHPRVRNWIARHARFHMHFTPTSASWLNMVERFFRDLSEKALRRAAFSSVEELIAAIHAYLDAHNNDPRPFVWTARASDILEKVKRARATLDKITSV